MHVPVWHEQTQAWRDEGRVALLGIVQEQHPDRARLFQQWKGMDWPILVDSFDLLEVPYVPITLAIDEHGIIRKVFSPMQPPASLEEDFLKGAFEAKPTAPAHAATPLTLREMGRLPHEDEWIRLRAQADARARRAAGAPALQALDAVITGYRRVVAQKPDEGWSWFRLGVAHRMRYDLPAGSSTDFQAAIVAWETALALDPNNYIWRRRIQQYGPRLDKPYPFYDWVVEAREAIEQRGETPVDLVVEPRGAEFAAKIAGFPDVSFDGESPDPLGKITRDPEHLVSAEVTVVPSRIEPGESARVHVVLRPRAETKAHWNNEVDESVVWVDPPADWQMDPRTLAAPLPKTALSTEERRFEFELLCPKSAQAGPVELPAYGLYYVCEDTHGVCLYRRQDLRVRLEVVAGG